MSIGGILIYCLRAATFAAVVCAAYALIIWLRGRRLRPGRLAAIAYMAALVQITVLRGGVDWRALADGARAVPQLVPLRTTLAEMHRGAWPLTFHVLGNLMWFAPLGILLRRRGPVRALLTGVAVSASIEGMQYLLMTGCMDVDDLILNALGALLGWAIGRLGMGLRRLHP